MIRQAHSYMAGAVSGTALIAAAVVTFVMLVSLQALKDWPLAGIGGGGDGAAVSNGQPAGGTEGEASPVTGAGGAVAVRTARNGGSGTGGRHGSAGSLGDQKGGSPAGTTSPAPSGGGAPPSNSASSTGSTPSAASGGGSGEGSGSRSGPGGAGHSPGQSTSGAVTGAVDNTVSGVDQVTGGALGSTGVTKVTEETVNSVAGPESLVGKTVDKAVETVGGLLGDGK